jgi:hypothetical protein
MGTFSIVVDVIKVVGKGATQASRRVKADDMATAMKIGKGAIQAMYPAAKVVVKNVIKLRGNL